MVPIRRHARDWLAHVARGGLVLTVIWRSRKGEPNGASRENYPEEGRKKQAPGHRYKDYEHSTDEEHRTAEQYNWGRQNVLSAITTIAAIGAAVFAFKTFIETRRQADIAKDSLIAATRPWVQISSVKPISVAVDGPLIVIGTDFRVKNIGHSSAEAIFVTGDVFPSIGTTEEHTAAGKVCARARKGKQTELDAVAFPDEEVRLTGTDFVIMKRDVQNYRTAEMNKNYEVRKGMFGKEQAENMRGGEASQPLSTDLTVVGCITYQFAGGEGVGQTSFILNLYRPCQRIYPDVIPELKCTFDVTQRRDFRGDDIGMDQVRRSAVVY